MSNASAEDVEPIPLARRADLTLGRSIVQPSTRTIKSSLGQAIVEPRVMQVILALAEAKGAVLSREDLLRLCWGGRIVGDDAINRAVAEARRIAQATDAGFHIETIPRIGYRLLVEGTGQSEDGLAGERERALFSRRSTLAIAGGTVAAAAAAVFGIREWQRDSRIDALLERGQRVQFREADDANGRAAAIFREAVQRAPERADAWGMLAVALTGLAEDGDPQRALGAARDALDASERALALDPQEPHARTASAALRRGLDDWVKFEQELRGVLADAPGTLACLTYLSAFLQVVGRCSESWELNELALQVEPFSPVCQFRRAFKHWIFGKTAEADRISSRAFDLWPSHRAVWNSRLTILAFTGRPDAALNMLLSSPTRPELGPQGIELWRAGLRALDTKSASDLARLREIAFQAATRAPGLGANAVMLLSAVGDIDAAYQVAEGFLIQRGSLFDRPQRPAAQSGFYAGGSWRGTQWLFTPATKPFRADERFTQFCKAIGYVGYWRERGIWPDRFVRGSLLVED